MTDTDRIIYELRVSTSKCIASMRGYILIWTRKPECVQRAAWAVEFDRECDKRAAQAA